MVIQDDYAKDLASKEEDYSQACFKLQLQFGYKVLIFFYFSSKWGLVNVGLFHFEHFFGLHVEQKKNASKLLNVAEPSDEVTKFSQFDRVFCISFLATAQLTADEEFGGTALEETVDTAYRVTSKRLLEIFFSKYKFLDHLRVRNTLTH